MILNIALILISVIYGILSITAGAVQLKKKRNRKLGKHINDARRNFNCYFNIYQTITDVNSFIINDTHICYK
jgi:hypothetical protein